ncbi:hypothetical protein HYH03_006757 [Edaphochlamys debaryana]|uniref:Exonuclease domain-containing protein n=1 Tax=Edaphochlamys debaryana TaxID=47281 RepID=A0A835Y4S7_9CHLO|nr:hypothetical protein HYH03_006757 [Edaphochlamys debaryana]|eukprot:KAG2495149.1 hypothetical protein HYH03_006757 [Edaphochlamys debaryana]
MDAMFMRLVANSETRFMGVKHLAGLKGGRVAVIDTETTGFPEKQGCNAPPPAPSNLEAYRNARLVSLSYLTGPPPDLEPLSLGYSIEGTPIEQILNRFLEAIEGCEVLAAHNTEFHLWVIASELCRLGRFADALALLQRPRVCTMRDGQLMLVLPKWPKLEDLYRITQEAHMEGRHNALADALACLICLRRLHAVAVGGAPPLSSAKAVGAGQDLPRVDLRKQAAEIRARLERAAEPPAAPQAPEEGEEAAEWASEGSQQPEGEEGEARAALVEAAAAAPAVATPAKAGGGLSKGEGEGGGEFVPVLGTPAGLEGPWAQPSQPQDQAQLPPQKRKRAERGERGGGRRARRNA